MCPNYTLQTQYQDAYDDTRKNQDVRKMNVKRNSLIVFRFLMSLLYVAIFILYIFGLMWFSNIAISLIVILFSSLILLYFNCTNNNNLYLILFFKFLLSGSILFESNFYFFVFVSVVLMISFFIDFKTIRRA
jgi:hypothetical protein